MNERDYRLIEYGSMLLGFSLVMEWLTFCLVYNIPLRGMSAFGLLLIGTLSMLISLIISIKHRFYVQEMQEELDKQRKDPILPNNDGASEK
jgi:hypothetical protein